MSITMPCQASSSDLVELARQAAQELSGVMLNASVGRTAASANDNQCSNPSSSTSSAAVFEKINAKRLEVQLCVKAMQLKQLSRALSRTASKLLAKIAKFLIASGTNQHRTTSTREHGSSAKSSSTSSGGSNDPDSPRPPNPLTPLAISRITPLQYLCSVFFITFYQLVCYIILHATKLDNTITLDYLTTRPPALNDRILRLIELMAKTGLSRSMIYYKMDETSLYFDPTFPKKIKLGLRSIGFFESEVNLWIANLKNTQTNKGGV